MGKKWVEATKIARKVYDGKILDERLNQKSEVFEIYVDDGVAEARDINFRDGFALKFPQNYYIYENAMYVTDDGWVSYSDVKDEKKGTGTRELELNLEEDISEIL